MKRHWSLYLSSALVALWSASWSQIALVHVESIDLSSYFPTQGPHGNAVSDVAFDGTHLYLAGFSTANSLAESVGVLKVANALSPSRAFEPLISLTQAGQGRVSYVVYKDGYLYLGTGLGDSSNDPAKTGIRNYDAATGTLVDTWNNTGVVMPSDLSNSQRAECIELDPGYQGGNTSLAVLARARGFMFRRNLADGLALPNVLITPTLPSGSPTFGMRNITFSPEGDAYLRVNNSVFYAQRSADDAFVDNRSNLILDFSSDDTSQTLINVHYMRVGTNNYLILNRRTGAAASRINKVLIYTGSGASWTPFAELNGDEPIRGSAPNPFGTDIFNFTTGYGPDPSQGDANLDGLVDDADLLTVLFAFGSSDAGADLNGDGLVDDADLLTVLFNFGSSPRALYLFVVSTTVANDRLDIYRVVSN